MRDSEIEQWVLHQIKLATNGRVKELCVFSFEGVVVLKGTVPLRADSLAAQEAAARGKGVVAVVNQLNLQKRKVRRRAGVKSSVPAVPSGFQLPQPNQFGSSQIAN